MAAYTQLKFRSWPSIDSIHFLQTIPYRSFIHMYMSQPVRVQYLVIINISSSLQSWLDPLPRDQLLVVEDLLPEPNFQIARASRYYILPPSTCAKLRSRNSIRSVNLINWDSKRLLSKLSKLSFRNENRKDVRWMKHVIINKTEIRCDWLTRYLRWPL